MTAFVKTINMNMIINVARALPSVQHIQKRHLSKANQKYIDLMNQNIHDRDFAFWSGFIMSSIVPYSIFVGSFASICTENRMLKTIDYMNQMVFNKQDEFAKQKFHTRYFVAYNGANGMFFGSIFFTMLGITSCVVGLKGVGFW